MDPAVLVAVTDNDALGDVADEARTRLTEALDSLHPSGD